MNDLKLGKIIEGTQQRDAIHIAVVPMVAAQVLAAGDRVDFASSSDHEKVVKVASGGIGIIDPFLTEYVTPGQKFWVLLYPNTVTSLRHEWEHPAFLAGTKSTADAKEVSRAWISDLAKEIGDPFDTYDSLMDHVKNCIDNELQCFVEQDGESMQDTWHDHEDEFWKHFETMTGQKKPEDHVWIFSCSC